LPQTPLTGFSHMISHGSLQTLLYMYELPEHLIEAVCTFLSTNSIHKL